MSVAVLSVPASGLPAASPGAQLAAAREARGLSIADIAQQLKLSPRQVEALETDDYPRLPGSVFVRGFIRNYARLVKLDAALLLENVEHDLSHTGPAVPEIRPPSDIPFPTARNDVNWRNYAIAAIAALVPLAIFEYYRDDVPDATVKTSRVEMPAPPVVVETAPAVATSSPDVAPPALPVAEAPPDQVEQKSGRVPPAATPAPVADASPARGEQVVRLKFARESWVEIRDGNGRKIFSQLNLPGTEQVVSGRPPLSLIVGNANGVQLIHNEQPVSLGPYIKIDVARLILE